MRFQCHFCLQLIFFFGKLNLGIIDTEEIHIIIFKPKEKHLWCMNYYRLLHFVKYCCQMKLRMGCQKNWVLKELMPCDLIFEKSTIINTLLNDQIVDPKSTPGAVDYCQKLVQEELCQQLFL